MKPPRLTSIEQVNGAVRLPGYDPSNHGVGIVHIGVGAFHRAHQAVMTDDALSAHGGDWRIAGINLRSQAIATALNSQNGLYTLLERSAGSVEARVIGALSNVIAADAQAALQALCEPSIRLVTLTVTEAGYGIDRETRKPDLRNSTIVSDLAHPEKPAGVLGLLVSAIQRRRTAGAIPFTVLCCDNLPDNGELLRDAVVAFAQQAYDQELAQWISEYIAFPGSMVDRITPASTDKTLADAARYTGCIDTAAVETEPFTQWIIEDNFPAGRPQWEAGGALFVKDVTAYERMKLTMLNGSHSMLAYAGYLAGKTYVRDVMQDNDLSLLVNKHFRAAADLLEPLPGVDFDDYAVALEQRFSNRSMAHETFQIASDGTQKLPQRIWQPAVEALSEGKDVRPFAFATAMWMRFCLQHTDEGAGYKLNDPRSHEIATALGSAGSTPSRMVDAFHALPDLIPVVLAENGDWREHLRHVLALAIEEGCLAAIRQEADAGKTA